MVDRVQALRGMNDILPDETHLWQYVEEQLGNCLNQYGYKEIRFPIIENTQLFKRTIGEVTDIVEKEMYTFSDLNGDSITLRPEGTAGCVRACIENGLLHNSQQRLWYIGPMFRHERPQKGRYRQFCQFGVEAYGISGVAIELEIISICQRLWKKLGIAQHLKLEINTIGELNERQYFQKELVDYFNNRFDELDDDSKRRLRKNPIRILDSKNPSMKDLIKNAPKFIDYISEDSIKHFNDLRQGLESLSIDYTVNPFLVRGLDYYGQTVFEWVTDKLGSQATVCAGGRYDALIKQLSNKEGAAFGFALGIERLVLLLKELGELPSSDNNDSMFVIAVGERAQIEALKIAEEIHDKHPQIQIITNTAGGSFKSQFKKADKSGAKLALILGEDELDKKKVGFKDLRNNTEQETINIEQIDNYINKHFIT